MICVFGIFFLRDMPAGVRCLWRLVRPGGQMAITNWGPRVLEPGSSAFWDAVRTERPDLYKTFNPWDRINDPTELASMLLQGGLQTDEVVAVPDAQPLNSPEDFWTIMLGSGYRGTIEQLDHEARERVPHATLDYISTHDVRSVETYAVYPVDCSTECSRLPEPDGFLNISKGPVQTFGPRWRWPVSLLPNKLRTLIALHRICKVARCLLMNRWGGRTRSPGPHA